MSRVGVGIIGAGNISTQYLENLTKFPDVEVKLLGEDGNAFGIVSKVRKALERRYQRDLRGRKA